MKIAVYSGSFNPLHIGHLAVMKYLTEEMDFDMTYLVVSPKNPVKFTANETTARQRYEAALEAVARHPELKVKVDDIELDMPSPQYTIRTLDALSRREKDNEFTFVLGADCLAGIRRWKDYRRILGDYGVVAYPRRGHDLSLIKDALMQEYYDQEREGAAVTGPYKIQIIDAPFVDISSTELRAAFEAGLDASAYLM